MSPETPNSDSFTDDSDAPFQQALALTQNLRPTAENLKRVADATSEKASRDAFAQWDLRRRAKAKFSRWEHMVFDQEGLEQSSSEEAARYHASLFPQGELVVDLTAGIGSDLMALAARGPAMGFEVDPGRQRTCLLNLQAAGIEADLAQSDGNEWLSTRSGLYVFADPSRRVGGKRTLDPKAFQPDPVHIAAAGARQNLCIIKLSPLLSDAYLDSLARRLEFLSVEGECKEVLAICGHEAVEGRFAVLVNERLQLHCEGEGERSEVPEAFIFDMDAAAVRAHAAGRLCKDHGLFVLGDSLGYLTGSTFTVSPWFKTYRVLYDGPGDIKSSKRELKALGSATPILKQRLAHQDLDQLGRQLRLTGTRQLILCLYPRGRSVRHLILERCT